jgi:DNA-binding transcriptional LysR family regulator
MLDSRLKHVVAVARHGTFSAAGAKTGVTQSAITKSVADLERQIGFAIFHRSSRGTFLTDKGRDFVERAARVLDDARELLNGSSNNSDPFAETLRIGVCPVSMEWRLAAPLVALLSRHPSLRFDISGSSFERIVEQLRAGTIDVAVGFEAAFREWPDLKREPLGSLRSTPFVRKDHPILSRDPITSTDLADFPFVSPTDSRPYGAVTRDIYESQGTDWHKSVHIIDNFSLVKQIVAHSDAIGVVAYPHAASLRFRSHFETLDSLKLYAPDRLCCAIRSRWIPKRATGAFIEAMHESFEPSTKSARGQSVSAK